jgi:ATP-dependent helicase/nuclease subunit A
LYVALTRARDRLILTGTTARKADSVCWQAGEAEPEKPAAARSHLDWLLAWLPQTTAAEEWQDDRTGQNALLQWKIYDGDDGAFASPEPVAEINIAPQNTAPDESVLKTLTARLEWKYPFAAATERAAKSSVSELRRLAAEEMDEETLPLFFPPTENSKPKTRNSKLSAAEYGTAHHLFLQLVALEQCGSEAGLRAEAERLRGDGRLSPEQFAALDFKSLVAFWRGAVGGKVLSQAAQAQRELAFTARFSPEELDKLTGSSRGDDRTPQRGIPAADEFVVVQGVADLVVLLPKEIWLLDFKTDDVDAGWLAQKVKFYEPQLRLYALALARIYNRPVKNAWLHFLTTGQSVNI